MENLSFSSTVEASRLLAAIVQKPKEVELWRQSAGSLSP
jgi:hypothetical protein